MEAEEISWTGESGPSVNGVDSSDDATPVTPPTALLTAAAGTAITSLLLWIPRTLTLHLFGYALGTFVTLGLLAAFKRRDLQLRQSPFYSPQQRLRSTSLAVAVGGVLAAVAHIVPVATYLAA